VRQHELISANCRGLRPRVVGIIVIARSSPARCGRFVAHAQSHQRVVHSEQDEAAGEGERDARRDRDRPERGYQNAISHFVLQHDFEAGTTLVTCFAFDCAAFPSGPKNAASVLS
jgi:hypothetical protein